MIQRLFIANRGEIALRIARTARRNGMQVLGGFSSADSGLPHLRLCHRAVELQGDPARVYLHIANIIDAARSLNADAIHPGNGFLAENEEFAAAVEDAGMVFVGPTPAQIVALGDKIEARLAAQRANVPIVPGDGQTIADLQSAERIAAVIKYPVLIKAAGGGGGRGMRVVEHPSQLGHALSNAQAEAQSAFNDPRVFIEKYIPRARHVEIQIFGDGHGHAVSLGARECSVQRRHQKLIEESSAPAVSAAVAHQMGELAAGLAASVKYRGAGTMEFIVPFGAQEFYFIEMNTRLQVEHPVTEMRTGLDLVEEQLAVASTGHFSKRLQAFKNLSVEARASSERGHAIEARIIAEDASAGFRPSCGKLEVVIWPSGPGIRVDAWAESGLTVTPLYDSLLGKVLAWGQDREEAISRLELALHETVIHGVHTTAQFLATVLAHPDFRAGAYDTSLIEQMNKTGANKMARISEESVVLAAADRVSHSGSPLAAADFRGRELSIWQRAGRAE